MRHLTLVLLALLIAPLCVHAQTSVPAPAASSSAPPPESVAPPATEHAAPVSRHRHRRVTEGPAETGNVEAAKARLRVRKAAPVYSHPSRRSKKLATLTPDKVVEVTGVTRNYLQVQLKSGEVGYVSPSAVDLVKPMDKNFLLTSDSPVYSQPNQWARKKAEVHRGRYVHAVGIALNYLKIRMKEGTEGYVPISAAE